MATTTTTTQLATRKKEVPWQKSQKKSLERDFLNPPSIPAALSLSLTHFPPVLSCSEGGDMTLKLDLRVSLFFSPFGLYGTCRLCLFQCDKQSRLEYHRGEFSSIIRDLIISK